MQGSSARSQAALTYHAGLTAALPARRRSQTRCAWCACCRHSAAGATLQQTWTPLGGSVAHGSKRAPMCQHTGAKHITMPMESCWSAQRCEMLPSLHQRLYKDSGMRSKERQFESADLVRRQIWSNRSLPLILDCRDSFLRLVEEYDPTRDREEQAAWLSSRLRMQLAPSADRCSTSSGASSLQQLCQHVAPLCNSFTSKNPLTPSPMHLQRPAKPLCPSLLHPLQWFASKCRACHGIFT